MQLNNFRRQTTFMAFKEKKIRANISVGDKIIK